MPAVGVGTCHSMTGLAPSALFRTKPWLPTRSELSEGHRPRSTTLNRSTLPLARNSFSRERSLHIPYARICGDAGCFIDPLFSSGVHLAIVGGLSAAVTIATSIRGEIDERTAGSWHSKKTVESYSRFMLAVSAATKQIRCDDEPVMEDFNKDGLQGAFNLLKPSEHLHRLHV